MDCFALGLRIAVRIIADGTIDKFVAERYASFHSGIGAEIVAGTTNLEKLEQYALGLKEVKTTSGKQEYLEGVLNQIMFTV
ncbi:MAG: xylose isomerase, partial [Clostridiales bacterium]|jgi:xylose isomerase|nr:xylose isomerase [Clostridiales bacterium]